MTFCSGPPPLPERTRGLIRLRVRNCCQLQDARFNEVRRRLGVLLLLQRPRRSHIAPSVNKDRKSKTDELILFLVRFKQKVKTSNRIFSCKVI